MTRVLTVVCCLYMAMACGLSAADDAVSMKSLLEEMVDRGRLARLPDPEYECGQFSSYDRRTKDADDRENWFANQDWSHYVRKEEHDGRTEWVMMDADGPGSIVRFWMAPPKPGLPPQGNIRIYLDHEKKPTVNVQAEKLFNGEIVDAPLSAVRSIGRNLYLPIPYAEHCKVTYDRNFWAEDKKVEARAWHIINYRTYPDSVEVETFSPDALEKCKETLKEVQKTLLEPGSVAPEGATVVSGKEATLKAGESLVRELNNGPAAVHRLSVELDSMNLAQALRSTVLQVSFDGEQAVWCPVGDFFGSGVGLNPYRGWFRTVSEDGEMTCYWVMPFQESCRIELKNLGDEEVKATIGEVGLSPWKWGERSMYFHAGWHSKNRIPTQPRSDFNYVKVDGKGVYVGDTLTIYNRAKAWWGEGDEKIFVDDDDFPSHFGTGTEDYYGYSFGGAGGVFDAPFHAMVRGDGNADEGYVTQSRTRSLDAIPFERSIDVNMEIWHWRDTKVDYAAASYWYARPGTKCNLKPEKDQARTQVNAVP